MLNRIILAEDDTELAALVAEYLRAESWIVEVVYRGEDALQLLEGATDIIALVVDAMLPDISGHEVIRRVCSRKNSLGHLPIMILTSRGDEVDPLMGINVSANAHIPKPFSARELASLLQSLLPSRIANNTPKKGKRF